MPTLKDPFHVSFTAAEFEEIEEARQLVGMTREQFYHEGVKELITKVIAERKAHGLYPLPEIEALKAAEDPEIEKKPLAQPAGAPAGSSKAKSASSGTGSAEPTQR